MTSYTLLLACLVAASSAFLLDDSLCAAKNCQNGGTCKGTNMTATCLCVTGYSGDLCEKDCRSVPTDVIFLLDASRSEGAVNFGKQVKFVNDVVQSLNIGPNDVQVGLMTFSTFNNLVFHLNKYDAKGPMLQAINNTRYVRGYTNTGNALKFVREDMLTTSNGHRLNAQTVCVVLTDGRSTDSVSTQTQAKNLQDTGALVIAVGVGRDTNDQELSAIASSDAHKYSINNFDLLTTITTVIVESTCV